MFKLLKWKYLLIFLLCSHIYLLSQIKFTAWPEMILWPYLMLKGWLPYKDIAIAHNPLLLADLTIFYKIFGIGLLQLKIYTWLLILAIDVATFWLVKRNWNVKMALATLFFLIPLTIYYDGNGLWFDLALALVFPFVFYFTKTKNYFLSGVFWGISFLIKQTSIWLLFLIAIYVAKSIVKKAMRQEVAKTIEQFLFGVLVILVPFFLITWLLGVLPDYLYWSYSFAGLKLPFSQGQISPPGLRQLLLGGWPLVVSLGLVFVKGKKSATELLIWGIFSSLGAYPRWELFHILPGIAFFAALFALLLTESFKLQPSKKFVIWLGLALFLLFSLKKTVVNWGKDTRFFEPEVISAVDFVRQNSISDERLLVLNYWEHFYALSGSLPTSKPWVPQFSWYFTDQIQEKMLSDLVLNPPRYVVYHRYSTSGLDSFRPAKIADFVEKYYRPVKFYDNVEILEKR